MTGALRDGETYAAGKPAGGRPRSSLGKAITYTSKLWPGLTRFLEDPRVPLDNNGVSWRNESVDRSTTRSRMC